MCRKLAKERIALYESSHEKIGSPLAQAPGARNLASLLGHASNSQHQRLMDGVAGCYWL
jgi:hypothetical protein